METKQKIESFMIDMNLSFEEIDDNTWRIEDDLSQMNNIIVKLSDPIVLFRVKIMQIPLKNKEGFYKKLLELNARDLIHGAYAIEGDNVVIVDTLQAENLDMNEFQSTIESIGLALIEHYNVLSEFTI
ncbi:YbjN domain-containing protein [Wukongibacter baidiensis]|uniref:YbjN domain-containing protein n=1 Tax=Wukongibacter baidiensis TaxID=1723361 RepID=UPI003D7FBBB9